MGKYIIRIESLEHETDVEEAYKDGIECDGFCIIGDRKDCANVAIHGMSVDTISDTIVHSRQLMSAGILAKAKKEIADIGRQGEAGDKLRKILAAMR